MDPVSLIIAAMAAGTSKGVEGTAASAIKDGYSALKSLMKRHFKGRPAANLILDEYERDSETWAAPLAKELLESGAAQDEEVLTTARQLLRMVDPVGARNGKYQIDLSGAKNVQVGDHNRQINLEGTYRDQSELRGE